MRALNNFKKYIENYKIGYVDPKQIDIKNTMIVMVKQYTQGEYYFTWRQNIKRILGFYVFYQFQSYYSRRKFMKKLKQRDKEKKAALESFHQEFTMQNFNLKNYQGEFLNNEIFKNNYILLVKGDDILTFFEIYQESQKIIEQYNIQLLYICHQNQVEGNLLSIGKKKFKNTTFSCFEKQDINQFDDIDNNTIYSVDKENKALIIQKINTQNSIKDIIIRLKIKLNKTYEKEFFKTLQF